MYDIEWRPRAVRQFRKLPVQTRRKIADAVDALAKPQAAKNVRPLKNHTVGFRLRVGNYRVLFDVYEAVHIVMIEEVKKRDDQTY